MTQFAPYYPTNMKFVSDGIAILVMTSSRGRRQYGHSSGLTHLLTV